MTSIDEPDTLDPAHLPDDVDAFYPCEETEPDTPTTMSFGLVGPGQHPATWLVAAFKKWGVPYRVISGWETRGRPPSSGGFNPKGLLIHHTGSTSSAANPHGALGTVTNGRSDLSGPLCQVSTGFDGITTIVAAGRANHAGRMKALGKIPAGDGNTALIGNEVQTNGTQRMPSWQYDAVVLSSAAILDALGASVDELGLHATTSYEGKWDLGAGNGHSGQPYALADIRRDIAARLKAGPPSTATTSEEDELMALKIINPLTKKPWTAARALWSMWFYIVQIATDLKKVLALLEALAKASKSLTPEQIEQITTAAETGAEKALDDRIAEADVNLTVTTTKEP